nr:high choriolytic enzyme 1-like isoform X1 [Nothobranchius furzeri]
MSPSASLLLLLLLGLSHALPLQENKGHQDDDKVHDGVKHRQTQRVDISTRILRANKFSDEDLIEGDLLVPKHRNAIKCFYAQCLWGKGPDGLVRVPYVISNDFNYYERQIIQGAANAFGRSTCIRYVPRTYESDYVYIVNKAGCYSSLGKVGGVQELSLNRAGCLYTGVAQHEMNHALGFQHEQVRSDRDNYVRINWQNITPGSAYNFYKADTNNLNTPYDYSSIMQYGRDAFSIGYGRDTITPIPNPNAPIGQRNGFSYWDIQRINLLYHC